MAAEPKTPGVVSERVAAALKRLRKGTSTYELSRQLTEIGWPIRANGITRIENGERRVDVDDLVALAVALGASPSRLLFPPIELGSESQTAMTVVGNVLATDVAAWQWASGDMPLVRLERAPGSDELVPGARPNRQQVIIFRAENAPHQFHPAAYVGADSAERELAEALAHELRRGVTADRLRDVLSRAVSAAEAIADGKG